MIAIAAMVYGCITLIASFRVRKSAQWRIIFQFILGAALIYSIDQILGYSGWSIRFSFPIIILLADLVAAIIMIVNVNGWQTYIVTEIYAGILGISMFLLEIFGVWELSILGIIAGAVSVLLPVATILFGHRMVHEEIRRRFRL